MKKLIITIIMLLCFCLVGCEDNKENFASNSGENDNFEIEDSGENSIEIFNENNKKSGDIFLEENNSKEEIYNYEFNANILLNNTSIIDLFKSNNIDYKTLPVGKYNFIFGKVNIFNKECYLCVSFDTEDTEIKYLDYKNIYLSFINNGEKIFNLEIYDFETKYTSYDNYLIYIRPLASSCDIVSIYSLSGEIEIEDYNHGHESYVEIVDNKLYLYTCDELAREKGLDAGGYSYYKVKYELIENNGSFKRKKLEVDYKYIVSSSDIS